MVKSLLFATSALALSVGIAVGATVPPRQPKDLAGPWDLSLDRTGMSCRVMLLAQKSDIGDYFLGMPAACRHAMPSLAAAGRWTLSDPQHLTLADPSGSAILVLTATDGAFTGASPAGTFTLKAVAAPVETAAVTPGFAPVELVATHAKKGETESVSDIPGRYAVMREKRDTGCMITLDSGRSAGGARAQLAPGCRDQGIVIFDPTAWQLLKGELVLTARAGHKTHLEKTGEDSWSKDPKDGKPLGLKKL